MIRDVFNMQVEEIATHLGHSTMVANDNCSKIEKLLLVNLLLEFNHGSSKH